MLWNGLELPDKPYYQDDAVVIYNADCRDILPLIPDKSIDLVPTSPPYNITTGKGGAWQIDDWYDDSLPEDEYQKRQIAILNELYRVASCVCYNHKIRQRGNLALHPLAWIFQTKWLLFQEIIWNRGSTHNHCGNYFYPIDERIFILVKDAGAITITNRGLSTIWRINFEINSPHPAPFPELLPAKVISSITPANMILDPFLGSGTTAYCAKKLGRKCIGIELEEKYCEIAARRCSQTVMNLEVETPKETANTLPMDLENKFSEKPVDILTNDSKVV